MSYAESRRELYRQDIDNANRYYRESGDLAGFQERNTVARETWHADILEHYNDARVNADLLAALSESGRVYVTTDNGETVRVHNTGTLYSVSDTVGAPATPLIARMVGGFTVKHTTVADLVSHA